MTDTLISPPKEATKLNEEFAAYLDYNRTLRAWFVAFGVGGPALFLINPSVSAQLAAKGQLQAVAVMFLMGTGSQVASAMLNKVANWYVYRGSYRAEYCKTRRFKFYDWLVDQFWIDVAFDIATIVLFGWAVWRLLTVFSSPVASS